MSRKSNCLDNAMAENFFGIMKSELLYAEKFESPEPFIKALDEYIDYYNNTRQYTLVYQLNMIYCILLDFKP